MARKECPETDHLRSYANGTLAENQCAVLFEHIEHCSNCLDQLQQLDNSGGAGDMLIEHLRSAQLTPFDSEQQCALAVSQAKNLFRDAAQLRQVDASPEVSKIGEYEVIRLLGHGGMGCVYLANHEKLGRQVALKVLARHRLLDPHMQARFAQEMRAIGALSHPNIVTAFDAREIDGTTVLVTEYIEGLDLGKVLNRLGPLSIADACQIAMVIAQVLMYTEQRSLVHRDIKPSNIMLSANGMVKVLDLGLARIALTGNKPAELTATGQALGSPDYAAPEQINDGRAIDGRADIYSLGCTLFKMLSGRNVFQGPQYTSPFAKLTAHVNTAPPSLASVVPSADVRLIQLVDSMLAKNPDERPQSAELVAKSLARCVGGSDLPSLIKRAMLAPDVGDQVESEADVVAQPLQTQGSMQRHVPAIIAIAAGLCGMLMGLFFGIVITITNRDGTKTQITVPDGSRIEIEGSGELAVPSAASPPAVQAAKPPTVTGFLEANGPKTLPTEKKITLFSTNKPGKLTFADVDLPTIEPGEAFVCEADFNKRISPLLLLDSKSNTVALSVSSDATYESNVTQPSKIFIGKLPFGPFREAHSTELRFSLLDHDTRTGQSLGVLGGEGRRGDSELVLFEGLSEGNPREVSRQRLPTKPDRLSVVTKGMLTAKDKAMVILNGVVYGWDLRLGTQLYQTDPKVYFQNPASVSLDRSMLTLVDSTGVHLLDTKTGADLGFIRFESATPGRAPINANSTRIGLGSGDIWSTYDLGEMTLQKPQTSTWSLGWPLAWIDKDMLLYENGVVMHTERRVPIWKFHAPSLAVTGKASQFVQWANSISVVDKTNRIRILTFSMPPKELQSAVATMPPPEDMLLTGPGTKARLELDLPDPLPDNVDAEVLRARMVEIMKNSEWEIDDQSNLKLVVKMAPGKQIKTEYIVYEKSETNHIPPNYGKPVREPVEITPMISTLELRHKDELVWSFDSSRSYSYAPAISSFKTKEEFIQNLQRANPEFFYGVFLPTRIARPPFTHGLGASREVDTTWVPAPILP